MHAAHTHEYEFQSFEKLKAAFHYQSNTRKMWDPYAYGCGPAQCIRWMVLLPRFRWRRAAS